MLPFLRKTLLFASPFLLGLALFLATLERWAAEPFYTALERKIAHVLGARDPEILVAGDSRAENQISPGLLDSLTGLRSVNIATTSCDLITMCKGFAKHGLFKRSRFLIVSVSSFQVNDGALDPGYISAGALTEMNPAEAVRLFGKDPDKALPAYQELARRVLQSLLADAKTLLAPEKPVSGAGTGWAPLDGVDGETPSMNLDPARLRHSWYRNLDNRGVRLEVFREAMARLGASGSKVILFTGSISPKWRTYAAGSVMEKAESEFARLAQAEAAKYPNMVFVDFYHNHRNEFPDSLYYDMAHLNRQGSAVFTRVLAGYVNEEHPAGQVTNR